MKRLFAVLTASCNLTCGYCFQNKKQNRRMSWETLRSSIDLLLASEESRLQLIFFGGEPLLELEQIRRGVAYALEHQRSGQELGFALLTNGTLLRPETLGFLAAHEFTIQLSFDGVSGAQDLRGRGTFPVLDGVLVRLGREHPEYFQRRFQVNLTLLPSTVPYLGDSVGYFLERGVPEICVTPTFTGSNDWKLEDINLLIAQYERILELSLAEHTKNGTIPFADFRGGSGSARPDRISMCGVMKGEETTVDVDGNLHACTTFARSFQEFPSRFLTDQLGKLESGSETASIFYDKQDKYSSYAKCGECIHLAECQVCPMSIGHIPGNQDPNRVPDFPCAFNMVSLKYRDLFQKRIGGPVRIDRRASPTRDKVRALAEALRSRDQEPVDSSS